VVWTFAGRLGSLAFAATALDAAWQGADLAAGVTAALGRLVLFFIIGAGLGEIARRLMEEVVQAEFARWIAAAETPSPE
jgi:hypothetical protein